MENKNDTPPPPYVATPRCLPGFDNKPIDLAFDKWVAKQSKTHNTSGQFVLDSPPYNLDEAEKIREDLISRLRVRYPDYEFEYEVWGQIRCRQCKQPCEHIVLKINILVTWELQEPILTERTSWWPKLFSS
jgi:hypothetical protein